MKTIWKLKFAPLSDELFPIPGDFQAFFTKYNKKILDPGCFEFMRKFLELRKTLKQ